jgi:tetratricopeptide (TPR) repeat protein
MQQQGAPSGNLKTALSHAGKLLDRDPKMAAQQASEILKVVPGVPGARHILGVAHRMMGEPELACDVLEALAADVKGVPTIMHQLGMTYGVLGKNDKAIAALRGAVSADPNFAEGWRSLAEQLSAAGLEDESQRAYDQHLSISIDHPELKKAAEHLLKKELNKAEEIARGVLKQNPLDVSAMRILADVGIKVGRYEEAQNLLERCLELAPTFNLACHTYVIVLFRRQKLVEALEELERLLKREPNNPNYLILKGSILVRGGDHEPALKIYESLVKNYPNQATAQMNFGHTLKSVGRIDEAVTAYRRCIEIGQTVGEAYWSLANLKTFRFSDQDIDDMVAKVTEEGGGNPEEQSHIAFALGKAYEDRKDYPNSFKYYKRGNAIRRVNHRHDPRRNVYDSARQIKALSQEFFDARKNVGHSASDPIFVLGLPRAGSTLLEQILSSHSLVEGTAELTDIIAMSRKLGGKQRMEGVSKYPEMLADLDYSEFEELGKSYLETTAIQRHGTPFFIDKMPNNFLHIGLIHLILPNAKIIDARRHPMAGCFAGFKQLFARGQTFTYDLEDIGHYYRDYVKVMDHWDEVLPGRVHRVHYEDMVANTETEVRKLLDYCGLEFEESCLRFYETERAIRTPSSEQVRQPIYKGGLEQWRNYEEFLDPLKDALGPVLDRYPIN